MPTEVLPLRGSRNSPDCATLPVANELVQSLAAIMESAEPGPDYDTLLARLKHQWAAVGTAGSRAVIAKTAPTLISTCREVVTAVRHRQAARRQDIANLVAVVRETVGSLVEGHTQVSAAFGESTARLDKLQCITNFFELKQLLGEEVAALRSIASQREQEHQRVVRTLTAKLAAAEGQLSAARSKALIDPLTEVANRRGFDVGLAQRIEEADVATPVVLALLDVDAFKAINDGFGHPIGDAVLRHVASAIRDSVRDVDVVARIGGDEFAFVASGLTLAQAESRLRATVHSVASGSFGVEGLKVSVSCGASELCAGDTIQTLMQRADALLAEAKALGKNRVVTRNVPSIRTLLRPRR